MTNETQQETVFEDDFNHPKLDRNKWFPHYLPHWSNLERTAARYHIGDSVLRLFIENGQPSWCPEFDGEIKVSGLQTGHFSEPVGSQFGQHRFREGLKVRLHQPELRLFLPLYCRLEMKARTKLKSNNLAALWLIGFEDQPEKSGEITVFEVFGRNVSEKNTRIGLGIKKINDPSLHDEFSNIEIPINIEDWHIYTMEWVSSGVSFFVDNQLISRTSQSPKYPMQLMLNFYELSVSEQQIDSENAWFDIDYIKAFR